MNYRQYKKIEAEVITLIIGTMKSRYNKLQKRGQALTKVLKRNHHRSQIYRKRFLKRIEEVW